MEKKFDAKKARLLVKIGMPILAILIIIILIFLPILFLKIALEKEAEEKGIKITKQL